MEPQNNTKINKLYLYSVLLLMFVLPVISILIESLSKHPVQGTWLLIGKWFIFWAIGLRLFTAGFRQALKPAFTAQEFFHIHDKKSYAVIRELGFTNICFCTIAIVSLFIPQWRIVADVAGGLFLGIAGINHLVRKPSDSNEMIPIVSNLFVFLVIELYIINYYLAGN